MSEDDPTAIFARLREIEIPADLLEAVSRNVSAALDGEAPRRSWIRPAAAWAAAAALAVAVLVPAALRPVPPAPHMAAVPAVAASETPRAGISSLRTPGPAQVLDLTVGDTQVVMIFDAELEL
jgi:hypothetical protein